MQLLEQKRQLNEQQHYFRRVSELFSVPKSILFASLTAVFIVLVCHDRTSDSAFLVLAASFALVGAARTATMFLFGRRVGTADCTATTHRWEMLALGGAWLFSALTGALGAYTVINHAGGEVELLVTACVIGYIAGISSRNASSQLVTFGQITAIYVPFTVALIYKGGVVHGALAGFISLLCFSALVISRGVHATIIARQKALSDLEILALHDPLTGLLNRTALMSETSRLLMDGGSSTPFALVSIDLDRFKDVNDSLGHFVGDEILRQTAVRLINAFPDVDSIARIGGDEFMLLLPDSGVFDAMEKARQTVECLSLPFTAGNVHAVCGATCGVAWAPRDGNSIDALVRNVDLALYEAKGRGRGTVAEYSPSFSQKYHDRVELENDLRAALGKDELELHYQPIVDPRSGMTLCCEALLRWKHPVRGNISPAQFIPIAELTGLIVPIGAWVLRKACEEACHWPEEIAVAVNLSSLQFSLQHDIVQVVRDVLTSTGLPASRLDLEITESVLIEDAETTRAATEAFRAMGISVSLDDFGTGFSSLAYLSDFPFSKVKIDRKFSQDIGKSRKVRQIVKGIAQITKELGIKLVAEGVETHGQLLRIKELNINAIQGYYFSRPVTADVLRPLIAQPIIPRFEEKPAIGAGLQIKKTA
jgi:diguanylate cyclase (GGDEF)-like protein